MSGSPLRVRREEGRTSEAGSYALPVRLIRHARHGMPSVQRHRQYPPRTRRLRVVRLCMREGGASRRTPANVARHQRGNAGVSGRIARGCDAHVPPIRRKDSGRYHPGMGRGQGRVLLARGVDAMNDKKPVTYEESFERWHVEEFGHIFDGHDNYIGTCHDEHAASVIVKAHNESIARMRGDQ